MSVRTAVRLPYVGRSLPVNSLLLGSSLQNVLRRRLCHSIPSLSTSYMGNTPSPQRKPNDMTNELERKIIKNLPPTIPKEPIDLDKLAETTKLAFELLLPWCQQEQESSQALVLVYEQAILYVAAIDFSITVAQKGFNLAEEAISFSEILEDPRDDTSEIDRQKYLQGLVALAVEGRKMAEEALNKFRAARETMNKLVTDARAASKDEGHEGVVVRLETLEKKLNILDRFSAHISQYATWWNSMEMSHNSQETRTRQLEIDYSSLRQRAVILKWKELKGGYVGYNNKIRTLQNEYPQLFVQSRQAIPFRLPRAPTFTTITKSPPSSIPRTQPSLARRLCCWGNSGMLD
ncbi:hypothetical protein B0H34DRAFT_66608 [Crassisporium funariophilum]|nr:hypothetical protein B0H34DRAFT_66608 [Crassisporium funariophilum]